MKTPMISVVMPVYNGEKYLREAIESILEQTYSDFEFIILNDGSTDRTEEIILSYDDPRIVYVKNEANLQIVKTLNKGIELAQGKYIARMDADDISFLKRVEEQKNILDSRTGISVVFSVVQPINKNGNPLEKWEDDINCVDSFQFAAYLPKINCFAHPSLMIKADVIKKYKYDIHSLHSEDYNLWLRLFSDGIGFYKIQEALLYYRMHDESISFQSRNAKSFYKKNINAKYRFMISYMFKNSKRTLFKVKVLKGLALDIVRFIFDKLGFTSRNIKKSLIGLGYGLGYIFLWDKKIEKDFIYFFIPWYHVGGGERVHLDIVTSTKDIPTKVIFTAKSKNTFFLNDFKKVSKVYDYPNIMANKFLRFVVMGIWAAKLNKKKNVLVFNCSSGLVYDMLPFLKKNIKVLDLLHSFTGKGVERYSLPFLKYIDTRIAINSQIAAELSQFYKINKIPKEVIPGIQVIENGIEIPKLNPKKFFAPLNVLYVGRGTEDKRVHLVGKIATQCKKSGINSNFTLIGDLDQSLMTEDKKNCQLIGETRDVSRYYKNADILLITSSTEGFPMVVMEAMAYGVIPVCTDVGGISVHLTDAKNGFLVNVINEENIVNQMVDIVKSLSLDQKMQAVISQNASLYAKEHFDKKIFMQNYYTLFYRLYIGNNK